MRQPIIVESLRLLSSLPALSVDAAYQLVSVGAFVRNPAKPSDPKVRLYFRRIYTHSGLPFSRDTFTIKAEVHAHNAMSLRGGSVWDATGTALAPSPLLTDRYLSLGAETHHPKRLDHILSDYQDLAQLSELRQFLSPKLFEQMASTPVVQVQHRATTFLIPCFELARAFYFWTGPKLIDFFFSPLQPAHICRSLQAPTVGNRHRARVLMIPPVSLQAAWDTPKAYSPVQIAHLAHLLYSPVFARSFTQAQASLLSRWAQGLDAHLWLHLELGQAVRVRAEGFSFTHAGRSYFWVCALPERHSYFCFRHLRYQALYDTRQAPTSTIVPPTTSETTGSRGTRARLEVGPSPQHDSSQAGSSQYAGAQVHLQLDEMVHLPALARDPKVVQQQTKDSLQWWITGRPTLLSERGGGRDLNIAKVDLHLDVHRVTYAAYFEAIVAGLRKRHMVTCLTQHAAGPFVSVPYCLLPSAFRPPGRPYRVAVAEIITRVGKSEGAFYFFQVLASRSKRSGFVYKSDLKKLTNSQLDDLLVAINRAKDDWVMMEKRFQQRLTTKFHVEVVILARNHIGMQADVNRCEKEMQSLAGWRELQASFM